MKKKRPIRQMSTSGELRAIAVISCIVILGVVLPAPLMQLLSDDSPPQIMLVQLSDSAQSNTHVEQRIHSSPAKNQPSTISRTPGSTMTDTTPQARIDVNSATAEELQILRGIGPVLSLRIVKFRDRLGGFYHIDQISETYGLELETFITMRPLLTINKPHTIIGIDTVDFKTLLRHPYLNYEDVRAIMNFKGYNMEQPMKDQLLTAGLPDSLTEKVAPYLNFSRRP